VIARLPRWLDQFAPRSRAPWWLHEGPFLWLVEEGAVDVFVTGIGDDRPVGMRRPLYRVPQQMAMLQVERVESGDDDQALIAVPLPQTRIRTIPLAELRRCGASGGDNALLSSLVASWVDVITRGMPMPPKDHRALQAREPLSLQAGQIFCPLDRLVWVKVSGGTAAFMGEDDLRITPDMPALPLRRDAWGRALAPVCVSAVDENVLMASGELWRGVAAYQKLAIRCAVRAIEKLDRQEVTRLQVKAEQTARVMHEALSRFVSVARGDGESPHELSIDPLLAACQLVGQRLDVAFREPAKRTQPLAGMTRLQELADTSGVRMRAVALKDEWWRNDNGPLLAFNAETREPCALLPSKDHRYELHVPATGHVEPVTARVAQTIAPFATQFYRPFPATAIKLPDIVEFALRGQSRDIVAMLALGLLGGVLGMAIPVATGRMVDSVIPSAQHGDAVVLMLALIAATLAAQIFEFVRSIAVLRVEGKMDGALQSAIWDRVLSLPVPFFRDYTAGDLANRINGVNVIRHALSGTTVTTLLSSLFTLVSLLLLFYYSVALAVVATLLTALAIAVVATTGLLKLRYERQLADLAGHLSGTVVQYLLGIVKLRVAAAEHWAFANWAKEFTRLRSIAFRAQSIEVVDHTFFAGYSIIINAVIFAVIGMFIAQGSGTRMSTGDFVAFSAAFGTFFVALMTLSETVLGLLNLLPIYRRTRPILEELPEVHVSRKHPGELQGSIEVVKLGFSYTGDREILKDASFSVHPGEFIALVGPSGSGKSTLLRLLLGFEKPGRGSIYYDNQDLADLDVRAVRRQTGVVLQGGQLMTGDILSNIVGSSQLTMDDAWAAARMVGLEEDIDAMPMGMHTLISEASSTLSVGQRQRILIARAIIHRPRILLFDEATSALDNRTQAIVSRSLEQLKATRIVIAHRLSTVIHADRIIVLQNGSVVQTGDYEQLIAEQGPFADLAKRQIA
jgi:NHLM bacteriocin system ABC transporter ATP-binding protein